MSNDWRTPGDFGEDIKKFLNSIPSPAEVAKKVGLPTPVDIEEHQHKERIALLETGGAGKGAAVTPYQALMAMAPRPPEDLLNLSFLRL